MVNFFFFLQRRTPYPQTFCNTKIEALLQVMYLAIEADGASALAHATELSRLQKENEGLRELLCIANLSTVDLLKKN